MGKAFVWLNLQTKENRVKKRTATSHRKGAGTSAAKSTYTLKAAAEITGTHPDLILYYHGRGVFGAGATTARGMPVFDDDGIYELRRLEHYRRHLTADKAALALIAGLLHQVARLETALRYRDHP